MMLPHRRPRARGGAAVVCMISLAAVASAGEEETRSLELGKAAYLQYCASCHGASGRGDGPVAASLATAPLDLTKIAARRDGEFPEGQIAEFIDGRRWVSAHGPREMPVWGEQFGEGTPGSVHHETAALGRILLVVEYLRTIQDPPAKRPKR